ncbi:MULTISPECIES: glycosyltransferase [Trichocoleus]|uniref:Glycosyltransferase n=1 Tax=Trichocoleus desertorum GB2-A4 TaxID=2933944 RepID=A0ABV0JA03_9CYAN|nr:glycosyltransferase [Trichocoleus sp. FACHB-46]MBD1862952.1 glycosyltransferase [Trichocoleus sp. FACHB-46]
MSSGWAKDYPAVEGITEEALDDNNSHKKMLQLIGNNKHVIDFGCATGYLAQFLSQRGCKVTGIEVNPEAAKTAENYCEQVIVADLDLVSLAEILPEKKFDVAVFGDVLEHLRNPWQLLKATIQLLKPDGYIVASIPNISHGAIRLALLKGRFEYSQLGILDDTHLRFFTHETVKKLFEDTGYFVDCLERTKLPVFFPSPLIPQVVREEFDESTLQLVEQAEESDTLQFVLKAYPLSLEGRNSALVQRCSTLTEQLSESKLQLQQLRIELEQSQAQMHHTYGEWERSQAHLHETYAQWEQSQAQLRQTQAELEKSQAELERSQAHLHETYAQWEQSQAQLRQTLVELEKSQTELERSQAHLHETYAQWEQSQAQLQEAQAELSRLQAQQATYAELEQAQAQLQEAQVELVRSQAQIRDAEAEKQRSHVQIQQLEADLDQLQSQLQQTHGRLEYSQTVIAAMQTSKFWKLRDRWMNLKKTLRVEPSEEFKFAIENLPGLNLGSTTQSAPKAVVPLELERHKQTVTTTYKHVLKSFLASGAKLHLPTSQTPLVTVVLVLYNRAELTFQCLRSLSENFYNSFEVVIVDNASSDDTSVLLDRIQGARIIRNSENHHFLLASNQAAKVAQGKYILFLNNDAQVLPGSIASAVKTIESAEDIGAVGGKILLLDGSLQEAGSIIWQDGSCLGYGRGDSPFAPEYMFGRDVDYCSGAFLLTSRELFLQMGGFDEDYKPAYYEEADYCLRLWRSGKRVVYDPDAVILHFEFASSKSSDAALQLQAKNREIFVNNHRDRLQAHHLPDPANILLARTTANKQPRVLFIDDRVPHTFLGAGYPRAREILLSLIELGYTVTFYPLNDLIDEGDWDTVYRDIPKVVEVMTEQGRPKLAEFLQQRAGYYEAIIISRPHNMQIFQPIFTGHPELFSNTKVIYDAEALFSLREVAYRRLNGQEVSEAEIDALIQDEVKLAAGVSSVISVSEPESKKFAECGFPTVHTLSHTVALRPTENSFKQRSDILFVGAIHDDFSPNADSVIWFANQVFPQIQAQLDADLKFKIVGFNSSEKVFNLANDHIQVMGRVNNLESYYNRARLFVVPTRFAAGIPLKIYEAASHGLPVVTTSLIAAQLGWQDGIELLVADDPNEFAQKCVQLYTNAELWEKLRFNILRRIEAEGSKEAFTAKLQEILTKE